MQYFLLLLLVSVFAEENEKGEIVRVYPAGGAKDLLNNTKFSPSQVEKKKSKPAIKFSHSCAGQGGANHRAGEASYEACMVNNPVEPKRKQVSDKNEEK